MERDTIAVMSMTEKYEVTLKNDALKVSFLLNHDPEYACDVNTKKLAGIGCEPEVAKFMMRVLRDGDSAIDAGANVGFFTMLIAKLVGPTGTVIAYEPNADSYARLVHNLEINKIEHVSTKATALWDCVRDLPLYTNPIDPGLSTLRAFKEVNGSQYVRTSLLASALVNKPRLIKMDVEGAECHALAGADRLLERDRVPFILCEMNDTALARFGKTQHDLRDYMYGFGYHTFLPQQDGSMPVLVPPLTRVTGGPQNLNVLFCSVEDISKVYPEHHVAPRP